MEAFKHDLPQKTVQSQYQKTHYIKFKSCPPPQFPTLGTFGSLYTKFIYAQIGFDSYGKQHK